MISSLSWSWSPWSSSSFNIVCCICFRIVSTKLEYNKHLFQDAVDFDNAETRIKWPFHRWKLPVSSSKLPFHRSKLLLANFHIFEQKYLFSGIIKLQSHTVVVIFQFFQICLPLEAKCDLLKAKNVLKSNFNISFQAQLCDIGNVSSFASHQNICANSSSTPDQKFV